MQTSTCICLQPASMLRWNVTEDIVLQEGDYNILKQILISCEMIYASTLFVILSTKCLKK